MLKRTVPKNLTTHTGKNTQKPIGDCIINMDLLQRYCRSIAWIYYRDIYCIQCRVTKLSDGKTAGGKNWLTDHIIDEMQNYNGEAIRNNSNNLLYMKNAVWAIFHYLIRIEESLMNNKFYPKDGISKFWSANNQYEDNKRFAVVFPQELKPIFEKLTKDEILKKCIKGLTQNQNESVNGVLRRRCRKQGFAVDMN